MKLNIGNTIKLLRREKDITQEEFADVLGVSCQSVSRWETGVCYPDMELLPVIAGFFGTTVDRLLGIDDKTEQEKTEEYLGRFQEAISQGRVDDCIKIAREGVAEYPNSYVLMNKLMYALFLSGDETGNIPEWRDNMRKYDEEITSLGERIMKFCPDQDLRLEATARLAFNHCEMGRREIGRAIYESMPSSEYCRENVMWWGLDDNEKLPFLRKKIRNDYEELSSAMWLLSSRVPDSESAAVLEKLLDIEKIIYDGSIPAHECEVSMLYTDIAKRYAGLGESEKAVEMLKFGAEAAAEFDNRSDEQAYSSVLLGEFVEKRTDYETSDSRPLREVMRDKWMAGAAFDKMRGKAEFEEVVKMLS